MMVSRQADMEEIQAPPMEMRPLTALKKGMVGQWVTVDAQVDKLRPVNQGMLLDLKDVAGNAITVVMYEQWYQVPFSATLRPGSTVPSSHKASLLITTVSSSYARN